jgi:two-component system, response regulator
MSRNFILLVEDNLSHALLARRAFEMNRMGNNFRSLVGGMEALRYLFSDEPKPALVLLDLNMPRVDGLEVLRRLRADARTCSLPVVMLTSSGEFEDRLNALEWGLDGYIRKPVNFSEFVEIVRQLGLYWLDMDEPGPTKQEQPA